MLAIVAIAISALIAPPPIDARELCDRIAAAHRPIAPYRIDSEQTAFNPAGGSASWPFRAVVHPNGSVIKDSIHPLNRPYNPKAPVTIASPRVVVHVEPARPEAERSDFGVDGLYLAQSTHSAPTAFGALATFLRDHADPLTASVEGDSYILFARVPTLNNTGWRLTIDPTDYAVLKNEELNSSGIVWIVKETLEFQHTDVCSARLPAQTRTTPTPGFPSITTYETPIIDMTLREEDFHWWAYAARARDRHTGAIHGPGDAVIDAAPPPAVPRDPNAGVSQAKLQPVINSKPDPASLEAARNDPNAKVLPAKQSSASRWLLIGGLGCLAIAFALAIRSRLS